MRILIKLAILLVFTANLAACATTPDPNIVDPDIALAQERAARAEAEALRSADH